MASPPHDAVNDPAPTDDIDEPEWAHRLAHLLWETAARMALLGEAELRGTPLTLASLGLLDVIQAWPGITVAEMSRRMPRTQQSLSQSIARMQKLGYIERRLGSGRGVGLHITDKGQEVRGQGAAREKLVDQHLRDLLGIVRYRDSCAMLEQIRDLLCADTDIGPGLR